MNRCIMCGHGLREFISIEPDPDNAPYCMVLVCEHCVKKIITYLKEKEKKE